MKIHSHFLYGKQRSPWWCWFITWARVHYPQRLSLCLLSSGHSSISTLPIKLVVYNRELFRDHTREANMSANSFHGDLFHRRWISFLNSAWPEVFLEYKVIPRGRLDPWLRKRAGFSFAMAFVNWSRIDHYVGGRLLVLWRGVPTCLCKVLYFYVILLNLEQVEFHEWCKLMLIDLCQYLADIHFYVWHGNAGIAAEPDSSLKHQATLSHYS